MHTHPTLNRGLFWSLLFFLLLPAISYSQDYSRLVNEHLKRKVQARGLIASDIQNWIVTDQYKTKHNGVTHLYIRQTHQNLEVYNGTANLTIKDGQVLYMANRLKPLLAARANATLPVLDPFDAIQAATQVLDIQGIISDQRTQQGYFSYVYDKGGISQEPIPVKLMYFDHPNGELSLVWDLSIYQLDAQHWWSVRIDALTGNILDKVDWVVSCNFPTHPEGRHAHRPHQSFNHQESQSSLVDGSRYNVYSFRVESPNHGARSLISEPADTLASPFGWHDTDGIAGPEFTITRGNNVHAYEDRDADNNPGFAPDGGPTLNFDFPLDLNQDPAQYEDVAITNLFYLNNVMHDLMYEYGFDEAAGNFQQNNYGNGGLGNDYVLAEAQDGLGTNNANFATPPDGSSGRMQMYLWNATQTIEDIVTIDSSSAIGGTYAAIEPSFGPGLGTSTITEDLVIVDDGVGNTSDACSPLVNASEVNGKIALVDIGNCPFYIDKVSFCQNAGAIAVIVINNIPGPPVSMVDFSFIPITIPSIMVSQADGQLMKNQVLAGDTVTATLSNPNPAFRRDGDFDNGIIAHEYGHGISIRLTGGPSQSGCLSNSEQMGEGWSDYFGLYISLDTGFVNRGIGTFALDQATTDIGIRPAPYSPDFTINNYTYGNTNFGLSQPHGIGFVWCTMLWDLTLELIDQYGFDEDLYEGTGGNNIAFQLITDGIKLQACSPGFVDGRDAILLADEINNGGVNKCLIWEVFARRGLGYSADQGSSQNRSDQIEAFDVDPKCLIPTEAPLADFAFEVQSACNNKAFFTDLSTSTPQDWRWDFGDGTIDSVRNPDHTYQESGVFNVQLIVTNTLGVDTIIKQVLISLPQGPIVLDKKICPGDNTALIILGANEYTWYDGSGDSVWTGPTFITGDIFNDTILFVDQVISGSLDHVGPIDTSIGNGEYLVGGFGVYVNFEAKEQMTIVSTWIDAAFSAPRTIYLYDNFDGFGTPIDSVLINPVQGPQRITLDFNIPEEGNYSIGGINMAMYYNFTGVAYPYVLNNVMEIVSTSFGNDFYFFFYDWEVRGPDCRSNRTPVNITVSEPLFDYVADTITRVVAFTDQSTNANTWFWDFGDGTISNDQNPVHTYGGPGVYPIRFAINGLCLELDTVVLPVLANVDVLTAPLQISLIPNPARDQVSISLNRETQETLDLTLYSVDGKILKRQSLKAGAISNQMSLEGLTPGVYLIQVRGEDIIQSLRLLVSP